MEGKQREYLTPFAELLDRLTVDQIKVFLLKDGKDSFREEIKKLSNDIDIIIQEKNILLSSRLIRIIVALAQLNLHIWYLKDRMHEDKSKYNEYLKLAHQLNGIRNQMKNFLLEETKEKEKSAERSNFNTDGLEEWDIEL